MDNDTLGSMGGRLIIGSLNLPLDGSGDMQPIAEGPRSNHLLDPAADGLSGASLMQRAPTNEDMANGCDSWEAEEKSTAPVHFETGDMVLVSLLAGSGASTYPDATGEIPCTPCTQLEQCSPLAVLCTQLTKALTPVLAQRPSREAAVPKRRPRQKRQPVANPR